MRKKIFRSILLVSLAVLLSSTALVIFVIYRHDSSERANELRREAYAISGALDSLGADEGFEYLSSLSKNGTRITVVSPDGKVIFDSEEDIATLGDHSDREEIIEALDLGIGESKRRSETIDRKTMNCAIKLDGGNVVRISTQSGNVFSLLLSVLPSVIIIFGAVVLLSLLLAGRISAAIVDPVNDINIEEPDASSVYPELRPFVNRIKAQNVQIHDQMKAQESEHDRQDAMRRDFTANVSHELKTPLTSISGYAEIIKCGIAKPEDVTRFAGKIYDESQRLVTLVGDIIKLSQLDDREIQVEVGRIDLYELCSSVLSRLEIQAKEKNVELSLDGEHLIIEGSHQIADEIIYNVCDNAVKYNVDGGKVDVTIRQCVDGIEVAVADTGIGIPKEDLPHVFERFFRVDKSHSREIGGTGLGLSIVKHGIKYMGAAIDIESDVGQGTKVKILF